MKKWKKWGLIGLAVIVVAVLAGMSKMKPLEVDAVAVKKVDVKATVQEKGKLINDGDQDIYSELQGKVNQVLVAEGDKVAAGTLLAVLDTADLDAQIKQAEGDLKAAEGSQLSSSGSDQVKQAQLSLDQALLAKDKAQADLDRTTVLFNGGGATAQELQQAKRDLQNQQKAVEQAVAALNLAKKQSQGSGLQSAGQKESLQARIANLKEQKARARIVASRPGTIFTKKIKAGDYVTVGTLLFSLGGNGKGQIETYVSSKDLANIDRGDTVGVTFKRPGNDLEVPAVIVKIAPSAEEKVSALGVVEDKVKVTVELKTTPKGIKLIPGIEADVTLTTEEAKSVIAAVKDAVFTDNGQDYVWKIGQGKATLTKVGTGVEGDDLIEITKGLTEGDQVLTNPHLTGLQEGIAVKVVASGSSGQ